MLSKYAKSTTLIRSLPDKPTQADGYTPQVLKAKYDQFADDMKDYVNNTLTVEIDTELDAKADITYVNQAIAGAQIEAIPEGAVSYDYLGDDVKPVIQTAGGTATAITLQNVHLDTGFSITFIASANNGGQPTTINTKSLYKPNTTTAPILVGGKAYTVWYNGTNFFLQASAEGDAVAANVLAGKTFSNDNDTGITGTMSNKAGYNDSVQNLVDGTKLIMTPPQGYYDGVTAFVQSSDPDNIPANIRKGVNLFGMGGTYEPTMTAGNNYNHVADISSYQVMTSSTVLVKKWKFGMGGTIRVVHNNYTTSTMGGSASYIYKNGAFVKTCGATYGSWVTHTYDLSFNAGDTVEIWATTYDSNFVTYVSNIYLKTVEPPMLQLIV